MTSIDTATAARHGDMTWRTISPEDGVQIRYGSAGQGQRTMLLIHGYPATAISWRKLVGPLVAAGFRVITPDVRGAGGSSRPMAGYDKLTLAADCAAVLDDAGVEGPVIVVGHDIGLMIAYAFARRYPDRAERLVVMDAPLPGTAVFDDLWRGELLWHFHFHQARDIPEALAAGKERYYLEQFWRYFVFQPSAIDEATKASYVADFSAPGGMRAGFELYRAFGQDAADNRAVLARDGKLSIPVLAMAGEATVLTPVIEPMMREVAEQVAFVAIPNAGHWVAEENPDAVVAALVDFAQGERS